MENLSTQKILRNIKHTRIIKGYSQEAIAYQLKISQAAYHKIESGKTELKVNMLFEIIELLNINYLDIFSAKKAS